MAAPAIDTLLFDLGRVLIDWDPRYLYVKLFPDDAPGMAAFLEQICSMAWHHAADAGLGVAENVRRLAARHPGQAALIEAWDRRWDEMFAGPLDDTVALFEALGARGLRRFAITNFPGDKWAAAEAAFPFLAAFDGILVSGHEGLAKPDPALFRLAIERFHLTPAATLFVDDVPANIAAAAALGFATHLFEDAAGLRLRLHGLGLL